VFLRWGREAVSPLFKKKEPDLEQELIAKFQGRREPFSESELLDLVNTVIMSKDWYIIIPITDFCFRWYLYFHHTKLFTEKRGILIFNDGKSDRFFIVKKEGSFRLMLDELKKQDTFVKLEDLVLVGVDEAGNAGGIHLCKNALYFIRERGKDEPTRSIVKTLMSHLNPTDDRYFLPNTSGILYTTAVKEEKKAEK